MGGAWRRARPGRRSCCCWPGSARHRRGIGSDTRGRQARRARRLVRRRRRRASSLPIVLLAALFVVVRHLRHPDDPGAGGVRDAAHRRASIGHQWWWEVRYPGTTAVTANEIHIPVRTPVRLEVRTADVIHSFWVPRAEPEDRHDPRPARTRSSSTPTRPGRYRGQCAEFCGLQHAHMGMYVFADPPARLPALARDQAAPAAAPPATGRGRASGSSCTAACASCHTIRGTSADGDVGPDLTHVGEPHDARRARRSRTRRRDLARLDRRLAARQARQPDARLPASPSSQLRRARRLPGGPEVVAVATRRAAAVERLERLERIWQGRPGVLGWLTTTDHKRIGLLYFWTTLVVLRRGRRRGAADAHAARARRTTTSSRPSTYDELFTMHGITMIFFFIIPMTTGAFGNYLIPLMIGARDMAFPRLNALSFWIFLASGDLPLHEPRARHGARTPAGSTTCRSRAAPTTPGATSTSTASGSSSTRSPRRSRPASSSSRSSSRARPGCRSTACRSSASRSWPRPFGLLFALPALTRRRDLPLPRPQRRHALLRRRAAAARRCCGSTSSGSSGTPRSTS